MDVFPGFAGREVGGAVVYGTGSQIGRQKHERWIAGMNELRSV